MVRVVLSPVESRTSSMRRTIGVSALLAISLLTTLGGGAARAGGSIRAYVLLPAQGRVAMVDAEAQRVVGTIAVPLGSGPIAASIDGSRVLVANTRRGVITQLNGIAGRRVRSFSGLGHPVAIALVPGSTGVVRSRYAIVADARGSLDVLDLDTGHLLRRIAVNHPIALAIGNNQLWVASAGETRLTVLDLSNATLLASSNDHKRDSGSWRPRSTPTSRPASTERPATDGSCRSTASRSTIG
jgi:DNA-binding beta-propeller fold protein YncE